MSVLSCTVKLLDRQKRCVKYKYRHKWLLPVSYCTKSISEPKGEYPMKHISSKPSSGQGFELKTGGEQIKDIFANAHMRDFVDSLRINEVNIQMLSKPLYEQIFGNKKKELDNAEYKLIDRAQRELKKHGLWTEEVKSIPDVNIKLPKLEGEDIEEHFWRIGEEQSEPYRKLMCDFIKNGIPEMPKQWLCQKGWTKYKKGEEPAAVPFPDEDSLVFDVEVAIKYGEAPVMAVAVSSDSWYGWVSTSVTEKIVPFGQSHYVTDMLIPLEGEVRNFDRPRIVIGHNVSYDRARVKEQYAMDTSALRFMDTMSLHICVGGASSVQKTLLKSDENSEENSELSKKFCLTSLKDMYAMYCNKELSKSARNVFVEGSLDDVREGFQDLITYCANDVKATFEVFRVVFPMYLERFPHPVTLAGMLEMGMAYLTVNNNWEKYLKDAEEKFYDLESEISFLLARKCDRACRLLHNDEYKKDLWMWNEDWSTQELKLTKKRVKENPVVQKVLEDADEDEETKELMRRFKHLFDLETTLPVVRPLLPGYPAWYRKLCRKPDSPNWVPGPHSMHVTLIIAPKVLNLKYENYPLHYIKELGWGILVADLNVAEADTTVPFAELKAITRRNLEITSVNPETSKIKKTTTEKEGRVPRYSGTAVACDHKIDNCCWFLKLPHKDGNNKNVGQPLSKSFAAVYSSHLLTGSDSVSSKGLCVNNMLSYWRNNRDRITSQMVVWLKPEERGMVEGNGQVGVILPKIVVSGTLTRRAVEPTWLTASKAVVERLGSELRSMVQAPQGYHFIGADVDSQELWIASLIGDSHFSKVHGGTPFGWMTISGTKLKGTDLHSVTAKAAGISREHAKIINYARIYGAGVRFAEKLLQQFNPLMSSKDVKAKAQKMFTLTKGKQQFKLKEVYKKKLGMHSWENITFSSVFGAMNFAKKYGSTAEVMFEHRKWEGGTESAVFNELEKIANSKEPETPFLRSRLSRALEPRFESDDLYMNTRINWVVQSGAVDFLHLMLVCMRWLTNGQIRYCLSFHDEVRYLVPSQNRYQAALALQITNLLTRSFFAHRVGLYDLPLSVAFFSSVEIDKTMRKEANDDCITPSNPHGLEKGYGIPKGETLTIYSTLKKSGGHLNCFRSENTR